MNSTALLPDPAAFSPQLLLVDDDPVMIRVLARMLADVGGLRFATSGGDALRLARESVPDLILLDAELPDLSGFEVCAELKRDAAFRDVPIIFVTSHASQPFELDGFAAGAADFIAKPVSEPLLRARVSTQLRVRQLTAELRRLSITDALTRVANRRMFDQLIAAECQRASRGAPLALLMVDVDFFKGYNDCYGHPAGDACLQGVAQALTAACHRAGDVVARVGGEEFALVLPSTSLAGAVAVAGRVGTLVRELAIPHERSACASVVTVSVGVAGHSEGSMLLVDGVLGAAALGSREPSSAREQESLQRGADQSLYEAKRAGRDRAWAIDLSDAAASPVPTAGIAVYAGAGTRESNAFGDDGSREA
ncbi:MAG: diguanylate cyclase [Gemmatimonadota bacterium]